MAELPRLSNAQRTSLRSLRAVAGLALSDRGLARVRVGEPEPLHDGDGASVLVKVESWDPTLKSPDGPQRSERTYLIETAGCIAEVLHA